MLSSNNVTAVGFGTAALGNRGYEVAMMALEAGFRRFDTAEEHDNWYDSASLGRVLKDFFTTTSCSDEEGCGTALCQLQDLQISTKIPPWSLTSEENIRANAAKSREQLVGFCQDYIFSAYDGSSNLIRAPYPLDIYYIHAPACWPGWHQRCKHHEEPLLDLKSAWKAMEAVVGIDFSARRIGLSNVSPKQLRDLIAWVKKRRQEINPPPRIPDAVQIHADPLAPADELLRICHEHGIEFVSYSTLGTQHYNAKRNPVLTSPIVQALAKKHARSTAEVALSWALQEGMSVIPRSSKRQHIQELARLLKPNSTFLDKQDMKQMASMKNSL